MADARKNGDPPRLTRKKYEKELRRLQAQLCLLQDWVKHKRRRIIIVFEGRDALQAVALGAGDEAGGRRWHPL